MNVSAAPCVGEAELNVTECVERVRQRDEEAARRLLNHLYPLVIKLVRAHLPRRSSEEDLAQIVFMKVFGKIDQYSGTVPLEHWVSRIAINTCLNQMRVEMVRPELRWSDLREEESEFLESLLSTTADDDPIERFAAREIVDKLLELLSPPNRLVIHLLHIEERSLEEVKEMTGWNLSLIKVRAFRARQKMKKHLARLLNQRRV